MGHSQIHIVTYFLIIDSLISFIDALHLASLQNVLYQPADSL